MSNTNQPVRFWLSHSGDVERIRVEWLSEYGPATSEASLVPHWFGGERLSWFYGTPPEHVCEVAAIALVDRAEHDIPGAEFAGWESQREMDFAADESPRYARWFAHQSAVFMSTPRQCPYCPRKVMGLDVCPCVSERGMEAA